MSTIKINCPLAACLATAVMAVPVVLYMGPRDAGRNQPEPGSVGRGTELAQLPEPKQTKEKDAPRAQEQRPVAKIELGAQDKSPAVAAAAPLATQTKPSPPVAAMEPATRIAPSAVEKSDRGDSSRTMDRERLSAEFKAAPASPSATASSSSLLNALGKAEASKPDANAQEFSRNSRKMTEQLAPGLAGRVAGYAPTARPEPVIAAPQEYRDQHEAFSENPVKQVASDPVSTFSLDVDTASYAFVRRALNAGSLPPKDAVRVEELINYFPYDYATPEAAALPFQPSITITPAPWNAARKLVHIGLKGYALRAAERPRANLVFLIDVSGSMASQDRLPLVKNAFRMLVDELQPDDTVGIVTYASGSGIALKPTKIANKSEILSVIDRLGAGGSTAGAKGIEDAYALAEANFDKAGVNRIILATDGDFNVGITDRGQLKGFIERKRDKGIFLSILGVGQGNYNDATMQALAQNGNGTAAYVDTLNEARKLLVEEASSTLFTIAKDVKIQVEFNPAVVSEYRLIGYETRALKREDFNDDNVDAGDVGSGHTVTAIYEITPVGQPPSADPLRYATPDKAEQPGPSRAAPSTPEYGFFKLRYKLPNEDASKLLSLPLTTAQEKRTLDTASDDVRFSVAVAGFGQLLRGSPLVAGKYSYDDVVALAQSAKGADPFGYRAEFINLARLAKSAAK